MVPVCNVVPSRVEVEEVYWSLGRRSDINEHFSTTGTFLNDRRLTRDLGGETSTHM